MTVVATSPTIAFAQPRPARPFLTIACGLFGGFALGVIARAWMRLISDDPEFSWGGTIFIVLAFTIFGLTQSISSVVRRKARRRWTLTIARVGGAVGFMPLFVGAGSIMMPTVVGGGFALWRTDWRRLVRAICLVVALGPVVIVATQIVGSFGWSMHALLGFLGMVVIYGAIIATTRFTLSPQEDGWKMKRRAKIPIFVIVGLVMTYALVGIVG
jgi:hypothetical protein